MADLTQAPSPTAAPDGASEGYRPLSLLALVGFLLPVTAYPLLSKVIHPYLHMRHDEAVRRASAPLRWLLASGYMRYVWRHHWLHHRYPRSNFNLLIGGDWIRGVQRSPSDDDLRRNSAGLESVREIRRRCAELGIHLESSNEGAEVAAPATSDFAIGDATVRPEAFGLVVEGIRWIPGAEFNLPHVRVRNVRFDPHHPPRPPNYLERRWDGVRRRLAWLQARTIGA